MFKSISVVVPCYNEGHSILQNLLRLSTYLSTLPVKQFEIIAVNDGSKDNTLEQLHLARQSITQLTVLDNGGNKGKGYTVKNGMRKATGDFICFTDADLSTPPEEIGRAIQYMETHNNTIVIGSRSIEGANVEQEQPFYRIFMGRTFSFLANTIVPLGGIVDTQCGFKCFTKDAAEEIFPLQTMERFSFDVEILYIAKIKKYTIYEMPITWVNDETSTVNPVRDSIAMFKELFTIRKRHRLLKKGSVATCRGYM